MKNKKVVIIIVIVVVVIGGYFVYNNFLKPADPNAAPSAAPSHKLEELKTYATGEAYITNVKDSKALCKLSASIGCSGGDQAEFMKANEALIRSCILEVVRNHTEEELRAPDAPQTLSKEMVTVLNEKLETDTVVNVYISDYIVQ